jgi:hypothetical protein
LACDEGDGFTRVPFQNPRDRTLLSLALGGPNDLSIHIEVPIRRLDKFMTENDVYVAKLIKIDVEGDEHEVIRGLGDRLTALTNIIFSVLQDIDVNRSNYLIEVLITARFSLCDVEGNSWKLGEPLFEQNVWENCVTTNRAVSQFK